MREGPVRLGHLVNLVPLANDAALIGAGGLGAPVILGLNTLDIGLATVGGLGIVLMAIILDRITQSMGTQKK